jgi:outer membrane PBP1 activator LpoA protein
MKKIFAVAAVVGALALSACNNSAQEQAADNIEANAEAAAENLEAAADNMTGNAAEGLENQADAVRALGDNQAEDMRTNDADTNLSNGI